VEVCVWAWSTALGKTRDDARKLYAIAYGLFAGIKRAEASSN
jgi:hypothetical protein